MFKSRNFTAQEILHRPLKGNEDAYIFEAAHFQMARMQSIRDYLTYRFKKEVPIKITSGYRPKDYNRAIGGADGSYHIWRVDSNGLLITANDFYVIGVDLRQAFEEIRYVFKGETYLNIPNSIIHHSPYKDKPTWIKE